MMDTETHYEQYDQDDTKQDQSEEVVEETTNQDEALEPEQTAEAAPQEEVEQKPAAETAQQKNFRLMRDSADRERMQRERAERERDQAIAILRDIERQAMEKRQPAPKDDDEYIDDDAKKLHKEIRELKRIQEQQMQQSYQDNIERRLRKEYTDFDDVMTEDNISRFARNNPRDAQLIRGATDLYLQATATYDGIQRMKREQGTVDQDRMKLASNAKKPRATGSVPSASQSPLTSLAQNGKFGPQELDRIRSITQGYINKRPSE